MGYFVYTLQSRRNKSFYKGSTENLLVRFSQHNNGINAYTKKFVPRNLVWYATKSSRSEARVLERKLKNLSSKRLIEFILKFPVVNQYERLMIPSIIQD